MIDSFWWGENLAILGTPHPEYALSVVTPPAVEPVSYADLAAHLRLDDDEDEDLVTALGIGARTFLEAQCRGLVLIDTVFSASWNSWEHRGMRLPRRPIRDTGSVTLTYLDPSGTSTAADFTVDSKAIWTRIRPPFGQTWPAHQRVPNAITAQFTAGTSSDAPGVNPMAVVAIKQLVGSWYENRESVAVGARVSVPYAFQAIVSLLSAPEV